MHRVALAFTDWSGARQFVGSVLPAGDFRRITIKPNWVKHAEHGEFPIEALVTDPRLIAAVIDECIERYPSLERIRVGDVPLQSCDWSTLREQAGIADLERRYGGHPRVRITFHDLRRERFRLVNGFMELESDTPGDPLGYQEVVLDATSMLEEVSHNAANFRVSDYDPKATVSVHRTGHHRYLVSGTVLDADLFINLPKLKTHQKSGVTGALKNLVGVNGSKAHLVHHQKGRPSEGGDEFPETTSRVVLLQSKLREALQKRSRIVFRLLKMPWELYKRLTGLRTVATREALKGSVYVGAGSWYGNDSIWRMVYDLNVIIRYARRGETTLADRPQRVAVSIMDGIIAGEGNGPLQPLPVDAGVLLASENPFLVDFAMARLMGFDWRKIPLLSFHDRHADREIGDFDPGAVEVVRDGERCVGIDCVPVIHEFVPAPGWRGHIELARELVG